MKVYWRVFDKFSLASDHSDGTPREPEMGGGAAERSETTRNTTGFVPEPEPPLMFRLRSTMLVAI